MPPNTNMGGHLSDHLNPQLANHNSATATPTPANLHATQSPAQNQPTTPPNNTAITPHVTSHYVAQCPTLQRFLLIQTPKPTPLQQPTAFLAHSPPARYCLPVDDRRARLLLITFLFFSIAVHLGWSLSRPAQLDQHLGDQFEYLQLGQNLLHDHELKFFDPRFNQTVYAYRTPGYPLFVALCGGNIRAIQIVQALLDASTALAIYLLARQILAQKPSLFAAAFVAFNPFLIYFSALVLSESLFTAMLAWGMYLLVTRRRLAGMTLLALSVQVRPSALALVVLLAIAEAWPRRRNAILRSSALAAALVVLTLLPWLWRNAHHPHVQSWIWTTTNNGITTYDGFNDQANGASNQAPFLKELKTPLSRMDEVERNDFLAQQAHEWIRAHPARAAELILNKIARTWSPIPLSNEYGNKRLYVIVGLLFSIPFDICILLGLWQSPLPKSAKVLLLLPAIYFTGIHALSVGSLRYRLPVEPPMAVIAGSWAALALGILHGPSRRKS